MYPLWDQIKAFMQSISGIVHKQADTLEKTTATANKAHETALYSRQRIDGKMDAVNPTGTGAVSFGRYMEDTEAFPIGKNSIAMGERSFAMSEGSVAIGDGAVSGADHSCAIGNSAKTNGVYSVAIGHNAETGGYAGSAVAIGSSARAEGDSSFAIGTHAKAQSKDQIVMGILNKFDSTEKYSERGKYLYILGNGDFGTGNSNAMTIDWNGNAWFQGEVYVGGEGQDNGASKLIAQKDIGKGLKMDGDALTVDEGEWELIEEIIVGYELLTAKPEDWETSWTEYHVRTVNSYKESTFSQITAETPPEWENGKYYKSVEVIGTINRTAEPNGKKYNIKAAWIEFEIPTATDNGYVEISFYTADANGGVYIGNGIRSASKSFYHTFALPLYGYINGWATRPITGKTQQAGFEGTLNHNGLYLKANPFVRIRIQTNSKFPAGSIIKIRTVRA